VPDFTSALYLGFGHPSTALRPWARLTTGAPAALTPPPGSAVVGRTVATLLGCERAALAPSTLHLFWDLFSLLAGPEDAIYVDAEAYPIARWGVERAAGRGVPIQSFTHYDPLELQRLVRQDLRRPLVLVDGFCTDCGRPAPLRAYIEAVALREGQVIVDDTQAVGIVGSGPGPDAPYGRGGGGSLRLHGIRSSSVVIATSLAKAFGVPLAVVAGAGDVVVRFEEEAETRTHCSPPSVAVLHAAEHALALNAVHGDRLRLRLASLVRRFRRGLAGLGLQASGGRFPAQTIHSDLHAALLERGVHTVPRGGAVTFLITALHRPADVDQALRALGVAREGGVERRRRWMP
jgi:8-amino-7-oxononanoate synthase